MGRCHTARLAARSGRTTRLTLSRMSLTHAVPHVNEEASGPSYSVTRLCEGLAALEHAVELICLAARPGDLAAYQVQVYPQWRMFSKFAVSPQMVAGLRERASTRDVVHNHSLWSMTNVAAGLVVPGRKARLVTSPRGTLSAWAIARSRWIKRCIWPVQMRALTRADLIHATSRMEYEEIRSLRLRAPVAVIPNGVDIPASPLVAVQRGSRQVLFLSRIHPKKGLDRLLHAWRIVSGHHLDWELIIAGRGDECDVRAVCVLSEQLRLERVTFSGPLYGDAKRRAYQEASVFVLPTHSENFGMVVAEALAHGCPAIVSRGAPWEGLTSNRCGWWIENSVEGIAGALDHAMRLPSDELRALGHNGRAWMQRDFEWQAISRRMSECYEWLLGRAVKPAYVFET